MKSWNEKIYFLQMYKKLLSLQLDYLQQELLDENQSSLAITLDDIENMPLDAIISENIDF